MNELEKTFITLELIQLLRAKQSWCGETHIQKSMFFLESLGRMPSDFEFIIYKHGPYSFPFRELLASLRVQSLVELELNPPYGPRYALTEKGRTLLEKNKGRLAPWKEALENVAGCLGHKKVGELEKLGTVLLLMRQDGTEDANLIAEKVHRLKPHVSKEEALEAFSELKASILPRFATD